MSQRRAAICHVGPGIAAFGATLIAGTLIGLAFIGGDFQRLGWAWPSVAIALPVGLALALLARHWPSAVALGLTGLFVFAVGLLNLAWFGGPQPLPIAMISVVLAGIILVFARRATPIDLAAGVLLAYASAALIFELSVPLHALIGLH